MGEYVILASLGKGYKWLDGENRSDSEWEKCNGLRWQREAGEC